MLELVVDDNSIRGVKTKYPCCGTPSDPVLALKPGPMIGELQWMPFGAAFRELELPADRDALVRLQTTLQ